MDISIRILGSSIQFFVDYTDSHFRLDYFVTSEDGRIFYTTITDKDIISNIFERKYPFRILTAGILRIHSSANAFDEDSLLKHDFPNDFKADFSQVKSDRYSDDFYLDHPYLDHPYLDHPYLDHPYLDHPYLDHPYLDHPYLDHPYLDHPYLDHPYLDFPSSSN